MELRSPESFWLLKNGILNSYPSLKNNQRCDIAVIGSGITGALISHALYRSGFDTILLDKRDVANGSSSATTSMLQYEIDTPLTQLAEMIGEEAAVTCYREGIRSIKHLEAIIKEESIDCGFEKKESLQLAHSQKAVEDLSKEFEFRKKQGFDVHWLSPEDLKERYKMDSFPGILSTEGASIDAFRFAHGLIARNHTKGMQVFDHTPIRKIEYNDKRVQILTEEGYKIVCKKIVFCTGFETLSMFRKKYADIVSTFACVCEQDFNRYEELKDTLIWDTADPYIYMRTTDDKRLLVGGEDIPFKNNTLREKKKGEKAKKLIRKVEKMFPGIDFTEDYHWAGAFGVTKDGLPFIGEHPDFPNALFVLGLGGNGITFSVQGMDLVLKILARRTDPLLEYYRFDR
ncbi:NAD(P)/FAD-dependent oxidoreductase [Limibacterium fermenti]|uniref:NAD(P)/FAD-dependent oxidoreductase n=1 Tax=Limibacterium fermenti TaxID=3229863 RepID=UPI000E837888|nr:FAD-dependent oxidoreductase [Porphyromonadaceae bacterium]